MITVDRAAITRALDDTWASLLDLTAELDEAEWHTPTDCPGWTVADMVVHVIGTEHMLAGEEVPDVEIGEADHVRNPVGEFNERWIVARRGSPPAEIRAELEGVLETRRGQLAAMEDHEWEVEAWTPAGPDSYGRFMRIRVFDTWMHDQDIRRATGRDEVVTGPAFEASLDEMAAAMPYAIAKLGQAPDGSRVELRLGGPSPRVIYVAVDGRGSLVDDFGDDGPTVTIAMDVRDFRLVAGGRADPGSDAVTLTGDREAGEQIVANLGYLI